MRDRIESTSVFKKLERFQKKIYESTKNINAIVHLYEVSIRLGFDYMVQSQNPVTVDKLIVKELLSEDEN